ncbi:GNAT family N-acetyltransferase [Solwaraspora sp. WMMA2056]|uniref:GNAT family N-acetyltransferase n=1 Tax=Solwaraspora sp. WMMA2056 TaxID=3015161 RepID=UPI00259B0CCF|nr:GNAT family N-acetyltransferase [Solwaraspora sp. WMMA2056]WJK38127.1 GNAT family N-acetyltransferase [Solwaraspora sp. WMMA2056]
MANQEDRLLDRLDRFCDAVPRAAARPEELGNYVLFVRLEEAGWPFYARPRLGVATPPAAADITTVRARQRELGLPESFEWIHEIRPDLLAVARAAGLGVHQAPLMVLDPAALPADTPADPPAVRLLDPDSPSFETDLATWFAVTQAAFNPVSAADGPLPTTGTDAPEIVTVTFPTVDSGDRASGTQWSTTGATAVAPATAGADAASGATPASTSQTGQAAQAGPAAGPATPATALLPAAVVRHEGDAIRSGRLRIALATLPGRVDPVAVGSVSRVDDVAEIVGVGTLPAARRQGLASAVTVALARRALADGVELVFLAAGSDDVAMLYHRLGFRRVGTACIANPTATV